ncbi:MAG: hypothetical protein H0T62_06020 [Parachlamydiaceae bacterium]|nr:hypothetical protein [Parachlamydiaceae bacterium]
MRACEKYNTITEYKKNLAEYSTWEKSIDSKKLNRIIYSDENVSYTVLDKRERISKAAGKVALGVLGVFAVIFTFGCLLTFKDIRHLFTGREVKLFALQTSLVEKYNKEHFPSDKNIQNKQNTINPFEASLIIQDPITDISEAEKSVSDDSTDEIFNKSSSISASSSSSSSSSVNRSSSEIVLDINNFIEFPTGKRRVIY